MPLWMTQFLLLAGTLFALLYALARQIKSNNAQNDLNFYKSLLSEIERAHFENEEERASARLEVSRKILKTTPSLANVYSIKTKRIAAVILLLFLPLGAFGIYALVGDPDLPAMPLAGRKVPENSGVESLVAKVLTHLSKNPDDVKGWEVLAPVYLRLENYEGAVEARRNLIRLLGASPERMNDLAEAMFLRNNGVISAQIEALFQQVVTLEPNNMRANYYLGLAILQDGKKEQALEKWTKLLNETNKEDEKQFFIQEIERLNK